MERRAYETIYSFHNPQKRQLQSLLECKDYSDEG